MTNPILKNATLPFLFLTAHVLWGSLSLSQVWVPQTSGTTRNLYGVAFADANNGFAVGDGGTILHTTNGGITWTTSHSPITIQILYDACCIDRNTVVVVGAIGAVLRTSDGGVTWTQQICGTRANLYGVSFINADIGTVVGDSGTVLHTTDGGLSWKRQDHNFCSCFVFRGVSLVDSNTATVVGGNYSTGVIYHTTDGGMNWTLPFYESYQPLYAVSSPSPKTGIVAGIGTGDFLGIIVLVTQNGGTTCTHNSSMCSSPKHIGQGWIYNDRL